MRRTLLIALILGCATTASAERAAVLTGTIVDASGNRAPKVKVIARGPLAHTERAEPRATPDERSTISREDGTFVLRGLSSGAYRVTLEAPDGSVVEGGSVVARAGRQTFLSASLGPAGTVVVRAVDTTEAGRVHTLDRTFLELLPTDRTLAGAAQLLPGVVGRAGAGLEFSRTQPGQLSIHGQSPTRIGIRLDGINLADPHTGLLTQTPPIDAIGDLRVQTAGLSAEIGRAGGSLVDATLQQVTDRFVLDAAIFSLPSALRAAAPSDTVVDNTSYQVLTAGPIRRGMLWYSLSAQYLDEVRARPDFSVQPETQRALSVLGQLTFRPVDFQRLSLFLLADPEWGTNVLQSPDVAPEAERQTFRGGVTLGLTSRTRFENGFALEGRLGYTAQRNEVLPVSGDRETSGVVRDGRTLINDTFVQDDFHQRLELNVSLLGELEFLGRHELKLGAQGELMWTDLERQLTGGEVLVEETQADESVVVTRARVGDFNRHLRADTYALFLQDKWQPWPTFTVHAGLRYEASRALLDPQDADRSPAGQVRGQVYDLRWLSPRVGVAWDPFGDGRTVVRAGYYQYADLGLLSMAQEVTPGLSARPDGFDVTPGKTIGKFETPVLHEVIAGVERELQTANILGLHFIYRQKTGLIEDQEVNVIWDNTGERPVGFVDGRAEQRFVLGTVQAAEQRNVALELSFERPYKRGWALYASYTLTRQEGTADDDDGRAFDNARERGVREGLLPQSILHRALVSVAWDLPLGLKLATIARYQSGMPYAPRAPSVIDEVRVGTVQRVARTDGGLFTDDIFSLDTRLMWALRELTDQDIILYLDVLNALGQRGALTVNELEGPSLGAPLTTTPPISARLGLRYRF